MWNDNKSLQLSKLSVIFFMVLLIVSAILAPRIVDGLLSRSAMANRAGAFPFLLTLYLGIIPAAALLVNLFMMLKRIGEGLVFVPENVKSLRIISWFFYLGGVICIISTFYYTPWLPVGIAAFFMGLVVRVVKNVIAKAVFLQNEADYTI